MSRIVPRYAATSAEKSLPETVGVRTESLVGVKEYQTVCRFEEQDWGSPASNVAPRTFCVLLKGRGSGMITLSAKSSLPLIGGGFTVIWKLRLPPGGKSCPPTCMLYVTPALVGKTTSPEIAPWHATGTSVARLLPTKTTTPAGKSLPKVSAVTTTSALGVNEYQTVRSRSLTKHGTNVSSRPAAVVLTVSLNGRGSPTSVAFANSSLAGGVGSAFAVSVGNPRTPPMSTIKSPSIARVKKRRCSANAVRIATIPLKVAKPWRGNTWRDA